MWIIKNVKHFENSSFLFFHHCEPIPVRPLQENLGVRHLALGYFGSVLRVSMQVFAYIAAWTENPRMLSPFPNRLIYLHME